MSDPFSQHSAGLESPASGGTPITPSDSDVLATVPRVLYATGAGVVRVTLRDGGDPIILSMLAGVPLPVRALRVWATGTTATGIVGLW